MEIVTHVKPHLDEVCCVWLIRRFWPGAAGADVRFVLNNYVGADVDADPQRLFVGVGLGRFDEHRGALGECATTLVWQELTKLVFLDDLTRTAVERLITWVKDEDLGKHKGLANQDFSLPVILQGAYLAGGQSSSAMMDLGVSCLDALYETERQNVVLLKDWAERREVPSHFGRTVALITDADLVDGYAYEQGYDLVLLTNRAGTYHAFRARAGAPIDLTPVAEAIRQMDPGASWFFHHGKHMLMLGGDHQPDATPSRLSLDDMIELVK
jgi:hypothetical protein